MSGFLSILAVTFALCIRIHAIAGEPSGCPGKSAEKFYAGYLALVDASKETNSFVAKSDLVTKNFKRTYAKKMSAGSVDVDPVLQAQDTPNSPFKTIKTTMEGSEATVILTAKYADSTLKLAVRMVQMDGVWKVDSVNAAK